MMKDNDVYVTLAVVMSYTVAKECIIYFITYPLQNHFILCLRHADDLLLLNIFTKWHFTSWYYFNHQL